MAGRDIRYGLRQVRRNPAFSAVAIATLALSIGGMTAIFSAFDTILLRPLPYPDADQLVMVWDDMSKSEGDSTFFSTPAEWTEWRRLNTVFADLACSQPGDAILSGGGEPEEVRARKVTWNLWSVLGVQPALGRVFTEDEDDKGVRVVVMSHGLWQRRFGGASDIVGRTISVNDEAYEVIGVMPQTFSFMPSHDVDMWMPASFPPEPAQEFHLARCADRGTPPARRQTGARQAVHGRPEPAGDGEGLPWAALGDRDPAAGRNGGQNQARVDCPALGVGGVAADCLRQPGKPAVVARRGARTGSRGARGSGRWTRTD